LPLSFSRGAHEGNTRVGNATLYITIEGYREKKRGVEFLWRNAISLYVR